MKDIWTHYLHSLQTQIIKQLFCCKLYKGLRKFRFLMTPTVVTNVVYCIIVLFSRKIKYCINHLASFLPASLLIASQLRLTEQDIRSVILAEAHTN